MSYEFLGGKAADYGAIEQMEKRSAGGGGGKARRKTGGKVDEEGMLSQFGLGPGHWKNTTCCVCFFVVTTAMVTAWMQTCVPFCGAKVETSGLWKNAWANRTIPLDMQTAMDTTVDPCDDFYKFSCGGFIDKTGIKADQTEWSLAWDGVAERISRELKEEVAKDTGKAGVFYRACMDTATIERLGAAPLAPYLDAISSIETHEDLVDVIAMLQGINVPVYFDWQTMADPTDPTRYVFAILDAGITLPEARMYTDPSPEFSSMREQYLQVIEKVLELTGLTPAQAKAAGGDALSVEMAIAKKTLPNSRLRDAPIHHLNLTQLDRLSPGLDFPRLLAKLGGPNVGRATDNILCKDPGFLRGLSDLLTTPTFWAHKAYLRFKVAYGLGSDLSSPFLQQGLEVGHILTGVEHQTPRWRKCYDSTKSNLPDEVAKLFARRHLPTDDIDAAETMLQNIRKVFRSELLSEQWMDYRTRQLAVQKLDNMFIQVGHGKWQHYDFEVEPSSFLNNTNNAKRWIIKRALARLSKPVDRERWGSMDPTQVDGSYARQVNGVFVPGGLLQRPFFDSSYPPARNYGSVGCLLGHEFTHGFDDVGRRYDADGRMHNWWSSQDVVAFKHRAQCLVDLYSSYTLEGRHVNGRMTLAENIADAGGLKLAYLALSQDTSQGVDGAAAPLDEADKQLFFLSWGQTWCSVQRKKTARLAMEDDQHAPDRFRVNGAVSQYAPFADAFQCPVHGAKMNPRARCGDGNGAVW